MQLERPYLTDVLEKCTTPAIFARTPKGYLACSFQAIERMTQTSELEFSLANFDDGYKGINGVAIDPSKLTSDEIGRTQAEVMALQILLEHHGHYEQFCANAAQRNSREVNEYLIENGINLFMNRRQLDRRYQGYAVATNHPNFEAWSTNYEMLEMASLSIPDNKLNLSDIEFIVPLGVNDARRLKLLFGETVDFDTPSFERLQGTNPDELLRIACRIIELRGYRNKVIEFPRESRRAFR